MEQHKRKMIAPILVTVILILYYILYFAIFISLVNGIMKILLGVFPLLFAAVTVMVCIERINEIKKGEEDDISKY